ncbi:short-chain fatty acyl-CoA regulator family protein [Bradyrhizobium barranii subsp. apii]|uniref:Short-chain fatty acyl-CoA regulator family protein n=1 Tax=Bradyrhizobium barranii subsp. apii TaxID=2819348 RepID=A0A8T5V9Y4_9BRAD|nr:short-chain fatty acyl-CoA regulator family protein [Bradyrhizobium barranii]UPT86961.1 short-chain fatty acyl-CoA regulator family protein [Bradyrhizobium barranii subsp. apii]
MKKAFMGVRLKRLREERQLTQQALAHAIGISLSYLNQMENNQRPLTLAVLLKLNASFGIDLQLFSEDDEARLLADVREIFSLELTGEIVSSAEMRELASNMPALARAVISLNRKHRLAAEQAAALAARLGEDRQAEMALLPSTPYEEVRDFFYARHNYFPELDEAAEHLAEELAPSETLSWPQLSDYFRRNFSIKVVVDDRPGATYRRFDLRHSVLYLSRTLTSGQKAFQLGTQIAMLAFDRELTTLVDAARFSNSDTRGLARIGLASYFAGALLMPYRKFLASAQALRYDIELLGNQFDVGFETVCHRLSTLQRPSSRGVPFFFIRVDRAGNISKRQSATDFHFSRIGGTCPLWNVYEAFAYPGRIMTQLARMPDERTYLWIARTVSHKSGGYDSLSKTFAVALGCDVRHAAALTYSRGLNVLDPTSATPIGIGCRVCERTECPQRAFPPLDRRLMIDETQSLFAPYATSVR